MTNTLKAQVDALAATFAASVVEAIRSTSLAEILDLDLGDAAPIRPAAGGADRSDTAAGPAPIRPRGRPRQDQGEAIELIVKYLRSHPSSSGEDVRKALGWVKNVWSSRVSRAIEEGKVRKQGDRRSTRYWAA